MQSCRLLSRYRNRVQPRIPVATVAASTSGGRRTLQGWGRLAAFDAMPRHSVPSRWVPGDPVLFDSETRALRQPLAAMKHAEQKDKAASTKAHVARHRQTTLSPWAKAAWQPGMPVVLAASDGKLSTSSTRPLFEEDVHRCKVYRSVKGKQRLVDDEKENVCAKRFPLVSHMASNHNPCEHVPFETSKTYEDPSPRSLSRAENSRKGYFMQDGNPSSAGAVVSDSSHLDPDSSIEFIGQQRSSPHSRALRRLALAQANLLEIDRLGSSTDNNTSIPFGSNVSCSMSLSSRPTPATYRRRRIPFMKTLSPSERSYGTASTPEDTGREKRPTSAAVDWDDPVLNPAVRDHTKPDLWSDSSDLPELPYMGVYQSTSTLQPSMATGLKPDHTTKVNKKAVQASASSSSSRRNADPVKVKKLRAAGRQHIREEKEARTLKKQAEQEELRNKYRILSYDTTTAVTPKVWYYRGLASGEIKFMGCDTKAGFSADQSRPLKSVLADLKGPLGWDLEWEPYTWNATFTGKEVGKAALLQLGDKSNIVLFQLERGSTVPDCLLELLEDPSVVKLGVQIKGDARKISRDYRWPSGAPILPRGLLDLSDLARHVHPADLRHRGYGLISLQNLVAIYLEAYLDKGEVRTSRWENQQLNANQRKYAANDIFASVQLYQRIIGYAELDNQEIDLESLLYHSVPRHDPDQGQTVAGSFKPRKAKPSRKLSKPDGEAIAGEINTKLTPRVQEAWERWWVDKLNREQVAEEMNVKPATVTGYIIKALTTDSDLPYDAQRLRDLIKDARVRNDQMAALQELLLSEEEAPGFPEKEKV